MRKIWKKASSGLFVINTRGSNDVDHKFEEETDEGHILPTAETTILKVEKDVNIDVGLFSDTVEADTLIIEKLSNYGIKEQ